jgi:hypothetical protein
MYPNAALALVAGALAVVESQWDRRDLNDPFLSQHVPNQDGRANRPRNPRQNGSDQM